MNCPPPLFECSLEVIHGRWAMLGALGALAPELFERASSYRFLDPVWWSVGYTKLQVRTRGH